MEKLKGLIVDDSIYVQDILKVVLELDDDLEIIAVANDGREAVQMAKDLRPDFIIMDLRMPGLDGLEAMEQILKREFIPIIVFSDNKNPRIITKAKSLGALEVLSKTYLVPENVVDLIEKIKELLSEYKNDSGCINLG